ncbi:MAG: CpsD/CapB family tyrosine-protein kinase [Deinococcales bacterium]
MTEPRLERDPVGAQEAGPRGVRASLRSGVLYALAIGVVAAVGTYLGVRSEAPLYRASVVLIAPDQIGATAGAGVSIAPPIDPSVYRAALVQAGVAREALAALHRRPPSTAQLASFLRSVRLESRRLDASSLVRLSVVGADPAAAQASARVLAATLTAWDRDRASRAMPVSAVAVGRLHPLSGAPPTVERVHPRIAFKTLAAALLGAVAGLGVGALRSALQPRLLGRLDLASTSRLPVLAELSTLHRPSRGGRTQAPSPLLATLLRETRHRPAFTVAIASPRHAAEKEGVAASLAGELARAGRTTLLVDADLRRPSDAYGLDPSAVSAAPLEVRLEHPERSYPSARVDIGAGTPLATSFDFVPSFTSAADPATLLGRPFAELLRAWERAYDAVLIDCPPVLPTADALAVAPWCDGVVLCAARHVTRRHDVTDALERLHEVRVRVLGAVLTRSRASAPLRPRRTLRGDLAGFDPYTSLVDETAPEALGAARHVPKRPRQRS